MGVPVAAAAAVLFFGRIWGVSPPWPAVATVATVGWLLAAWARWPMLRSGSERWLMPGVVAVACAAVFYWGGWKLPRGLVHASVLVLGLAVIEGALSRGKPHPFFARLVMGGFAGLLIFKVFSTMQAGRAGELAGWDRGPAGIGWRVGLMAVALLGSVWLIGQADRVAVWGGVRRGLRSVIFAAGVWLPLVWWDAAELVREFQRPENAAFVALVYLVAWGRPQGASERGPGKRWPVLVASIVLCVLCAAGAMVWDAPGAAPPRLVFFGVAVGAAVLASMIGLAWAIGKPGRAAGWFPEVALVAMALTALTRS